ncbi:MAG: hypothetical protein WCD08_13935 [Steroidobacteraceae bacterium]
MFDTVSEVESFIQDFEACRLPKERWTHTAHLVAGFWYLSRHDMTQALDTIRSRIRSHNESVGTANTDTGGYHETITRLYMRAIAAHIALHEALPFERSLAALLASPLAKSDWPLSHYTREHLFSTHARHNWVEPDLMAATTSRNLKC